MKKLDDTFALLANNSGTNTGDETASSIGAVLPAAITEAGAAEVRAAAGVPFIYAEDYGVVYTTSDDVTAAANSTALTAAFADASSTGSTLIIRGVVHTKGENLIEGVGIRVRGEKGAAIVQKDTAHNGVTLSTVTPPYGLIWDGVSISGQGAATHDAAAIYGQRGDLSYLTSDIAFSNCSLSSFRKGFNLAGLAKFRTENVSINNVRIGHEWNHMQTALLTNSRIVTGDSNAASTCFEITGGNFFANRVIGGEFGGSGFARFLNMSSGILYVDSANLEAFTSAQTINLTGTGEKRIGLKNCRIAVAYTAATDAIISAEIDGNTGIPKIEFVGNHGWTGTPRKVELYGSYASASSPPIIKGEPTYVGYTATQGGATYQAVDARPGEYVIFSSASIPVSGPLEGRNIAFVSPTGTGPDAHSSNYLTKIYDNNAAGYRWSSTVNDFLARTLYAAGQIAGAAGTPTELLSTSIPKGAMTNNGESVRLVCFGTTAANTNNKQFRVMVGGSEYIDFGAIAANTSSWKCEVEMIRASNSPGTGYIRMVGTLMIGAQIVVKHKQSPDATLDSSAAIPVTITGEGVAASDIISLAAKATWSRAVSAL